MFRDLLPRIYELRDTVADPEDETCFLKDLGQRLLDERIRLKQFREIEVDLGGLDQAAWDHLKAEIFTNRLLTKRGTRGFSQLLDKFGEAKGYCHLKQRGFDAVSFIPRSDIETPDLQALTTDGRRVLCEVKTINISEDEAKRRRLGGVFSVEASLNDGFLGKIDKTLAKASSQMSTFNPDPAVVRIAFVIVKFDDLLHEYEDRYKVQLAQYVQSRPSDGLEVAFQWMPAFGTARA